MSDPTQHGNASVVPTVPMQPKAPEWDEYWAHQVAEKAKKKVLAYFGLATGLVSLLVTLYGINGIQKLLDERFARVVEGKEKEAVARIESHLKEFETELTMRQAHVQSRAEEFEKTIAVRAQALENLQPKPGTLAAIDLSAEIGKIRDTGPEGTTIGFSIAYAMQAAIKAQTGQQVTVSARGLYELAKQHDEWPGENYEGTSLLGGLKAAKMIGAYLETDWPYSERKVPATAKPSYRVISFDPVKGTDGIIGALKQRRVVIAQVRVTEDFANAGKDGKVVVRSLQSGTIGTKGICIVGYDPDSAEFRFANDWGAAWGRQGFGLIRDTDLQKLLQAAYTLEALKL